jgi:hypothetical protein
MWHRLSACVGCAGAEKRQFGAQGTQAKSLCHEKFTDSELVEVNEEPGMRTQAATARLSPRAAEASAMNSDLASPATHPSACAETEEFRAGRAVIVSFAVLGVVLLALGIAFPFVAKDVVWGLALISLPCVVVGGWLVTRVPGLIHSRILIDADGMELRIPVWACGMLRKGTPARIAWADVQRLTRTWKIYYPLIVIPFAVEEFSIHTAKGTFILTKNIIPRPARVMEAIAARSGKRVETV